MRTKVLARFGLWAVILLGTAGVSAAEELPADRIVALVNGEIITRSEVEEAAARSYSLQSLIEKTLQLQAARQKGIVVDPREVDKAVAESLGRQNGLPSPEVLERNLPPGFPNLEAFRREIQDQLTLLRLIDREVRAKIVVDAEEVSAYYTDHPDLFRLPPETRLSMIFLEIPKNAPPEVVDEIKARAEKVRRNLLAGGNFEETARAVSQGPEASHGGDMGYFQPGDLIPELEKAADSLREGEVSPVVATTSGYHLIKVTDRREGALLPYSEVENSIEEILSRKKFDQLYKDWFTHLRSSAYVEIRP